MKKFYYALGLTALALVLVVPSITMAENSRPETIRAKLRADYEARLQNAKNNEDIRNNMMVNARLSTTTRTKMMDTPTESSKDNDDEDDSRSHMMSSTTASTTIMMRRGENGDEIRDRIKENTEEMMTKTLKIRKEGIVKELNVAIRNLNQVRSRIDSRITKEKRAGKNMTNAINLLVTADAKIVIAVNDVNILDAYIPSATSTVSASTTISLETARGLAKTAQRSIRDAKNALNDVIVAIAHSMGLKLENDEHATTTSTTTEQ